MNDSATHATGRLCASASLPGLLAVVANGLDLADRCAALVRSLW